VLEMQCEHEHEHVEKTYSETLKYYKQTNKQTKGQCVSVCVCVQDDTYTLEVKTYHDRHCILYCDESTTTC
jgi:hypothetical protein